MARNNRMKEMSTSDKVILYSGIGIVILAIIVTALFLYSKNLNDEVKNSTMSLEDMANITNNTTANTESASTQIGKSVEESQNEMNNINNTNTLSNSTNTINTTNSVNTNNTQKNTVISNSTNSTITTNTENQKTETKKEWAFVKPVEGEIVKEYAKDNLIYSNTLQEWTTHTGIDIKADKTTVVKSAEEGTVKSIKNDPRYGLTVTIEHNDGYTSVYSSLLSAEFVKEGEKVTQGQTIGTVGNSSVFEVAEDNHLHFELLKDGSNINPEIYLK